MHLRVRSVEVIVSMIRVNQHIIPGPVRKFELVLSATDLFTNHNALGYQLLDLCYW